MIAYLTAPLARLGCFRSALVPAPALNFRPQRRSQSRASARLLRSARRAAPLLTTSKHTATATAARASSGWKMEDEDE